MRGNFRYYLTIVAPEFYLLGLLKSLKNNTLTINETLKKHREPKRRETMLTDKSRIASKESMRVRQLME